MKLKTNRKWLFIPIALMVLCLLGIAAIFVANLFLPSGSAAVERLSADEKARLAEAFHLRQTVGAAAWPGWDEAEIPLVVYNEAYAFLVGYPADPPAGWRPVPGDEGIGNPWERLPDDTFFGEPYYRTRLPRQDVTPQAFTIRIGDAWVASMPTKEWAEIRLAGEFRQDLPGFLRSVFPYGPIVRLFLGGSDKHVTLLLHESFHAFEGIVAPERLVTAEQVGRRYEGQYPWDGPGLEAAWQAELDLLADAAEQAVDGGSTAEVTALAQQFLDHRAARRQAAGLSQDLIEYEQQREWVEGQAKYMELAMWRLAATTAGYTPHPEVATLDDFDAYRGADTAWSREIDQIRRMAGDEGDGRFYYSGLAQAILLDRLLPGWQAKAMEQDVFLEDLLAATIRDQLVTFIAFVNVSASEQVVLDLGVYNGGNDVPANEAFNGVWRLEHKEGTARAAGIVHTLPRLPGGQEEMLIQWTGALAPGSYQLTWGAPGYGTTVVGFDVKEVGGHLQIGDQEIFNTTSDPPAGLLDDVETIAPPAGE